MPYLVAEVFRHASFGPELVDCSVACLAAFCRLKGSINTAEASIIAKIMVPYSECG